MRLIPAALTLVLLAGPAVAGSLSPDEVAELRHKQKKAEAEVDKKHGNKKPSDMTENERRQVDNEKMAARAAVLEKEGVSSKEFDRAQLRQNKADRAQTDEKVKALEKKDAEAAAAAKAKAEADQQQGEVRIQRGFNEERPVELENQSGEPTVEKGIPEDVQRDIDEAKLQDTGEQGEAPRGEAPKPAKGKAARSK